MVCVGNYSPAEWLNLNVDRLHPTSHNLWYFLRVIDPPIIGIKNIPCFVNAFNIVIFDVFRQNDVIEGGLLRTSLRKPEVLDGKVYIRSSIFNTNLQWEHSHHPVLSVYGIYQIF